MYPRRQILAHRGAETCFLWGPRQTGKSTLLHHLFPQAKVYDLLLADQFTRFNRNPSLLREELLAADPPHPLPIIIDEVQKVPLLLDEVQWLIVNKKIFFSLFFA